MAQPISTELCRMRRRTRPRRSPARRRPLSSAQLRATSCTSAITCPCRTKRGMSRIVIETMSDMTGAALPNRESTLSCGKISRAAWNHRTLAMNIAAMTTPYSRLSAYTGMPNGENSNVLPRCANRGFTQASNAMSGSCQRKASSVGRTPRATAPYVSAPARDSDTSTGCGANMVRPSVHARNAAGTAGCIVPNAVCLGACAIRSPSSANRPFKKQPGPPGPGCTSGGRATAHIEHVRYIAKSPPTSVLTDCS